MGAATRLAGSFATLVVAGAVVGCGPHDDVGPNAGNFPNDGPAQPLAGRAPDAGSDAAAGGGSGLPRPAGCPDGRRGWSPMRPVPLHPGHELERATLVWTGTRAVLVGRSLDVSTGARRDVYAAYDVATDTWTAIPDPSPGMWGDARAVPRAVVGSGRVFVWGGVLGAVHDPATSTWTAIPSPPEAVSKGPRFDPGLVWSTTTDELLVFGGVSATGEPRVDGAAYRPSSGTWRRIPEAPVRARVGPVVWSGRSMILLGGRDPSCERCAPFDDGASYEPRRDAWRRIEGPASFGRRGTEVALPVADAAPSVLFFGGVVGGKDSVAVAGTREDGLLLDAATHASEYVPAPQAAVLRPAFSRRGYASWVGGGRFWLWGGEGTRERGGPEETFGDGASWDFATKTWAPIPTATGDTPGPGPRADAAAVWTGCEAIVLGGRRGEVRLNDGAVLRP